jgi:hypothetical protein
MQTQVVAQQCAELQHWSGLSTVTRFDAGNNGSNVRVVLLRLYLCFDF